MNISCVWEHNGNDTILYATELPGAFTRGKTLEVALGKMKAEIRSYLKWTDAPLPERIDITLCQEKTSELDIADADSDVLFESETAPIPKEDYLRLKELALKSAADFHTLYESIPDKHRSAAPARKTFYGHVPRTAEEMYQHTKSVNTFYFGEIEVDTDNDGSIWDCRQRGFAALEQKPDYLQNPVIEGSYGESWSLRKLLRRFIWHDRIHAKAMYRMAIREFGKDTIPNIFFFEV